MEKPAKRFIIRKKTIKNPEEPTKVVSNSMKCQCGGEYTFTSGYVPRECCGDVYNSDSEYTPRYVKGLDSPNYSPRGYSVDTKGKECNEYNEPLVDFDSDTDIFGVKKGEQGYSGPTTPVKQPRKIQRDYRRDNRQDYRRDDRNYKRDDRNYQRDDRNYQRDDRNYQRDYRSGDRSDRHNDRPKYYRDEPNPHNGGSYNRRDPSKCKSELDNELDKYSRKF
jgi:hypothetical protein